MENRFHENVKAAWYSPVFSSIFSSQRNLAIIAGAGVLHVGFSLAGITLWNCPIRAATGIPCPGCGLTRASLELLRGDVSGSFQTHAFAPLVLGAMVVMLLLLFVPELLRGKWVAKIRDVETRFGSTAWTLTLLSLYWVIRLFGFLPFPDNF